MPESSSAALAEVLRVLRRPDIPHMLVGAFSSNAYGYPQSTSSAAIAVEREADTLPRILGNLGEGFSLDPQLTFELKTGTIWSIVAYYPTKFDIEFFFLSDGPHDRQRFARRRKILLPDLGVEDVIPTAEDVVIQKLRWGHDKDIADARMVVLVQRDSLDWPYIRRWTDEHGTSFTSDAIQGDESPRICW